MERHAEGYEENERCFGEGKGVKERANHFFLVLHGMSTIHRQHEEIACLRIEN